MSAQKFGFTGVLALVVGHCAGMIDLIALPIWIGALVERYNFSPQQAGSHVTLFLLGAVVASVLLAPQLNRINQRLVASAGFGLGAVAFFLASSQTAFVPLAGLHLVAGVAVGSALSMVHGMMGHSANPHRIYALAGIAIGLFAIILLAALPQLLIASGGPILFQVFGGVMALAALTSIAFFPNSTAAYVQDTTGFSRATWLTVFGISTMTFNQSMVFSFVEVIGKARGFEAGAVLAVLIALGFVNFLIPSPFAALLEKRIPATLVTQMGPAVQIVLAIIVTSATSIVLWAPAASLFVAVQIFTHTFAFGRLAQLDPTGRSVAATPAMLMVGAALGPIVGGALGQTFGFQALGAAAVVVGLISIIFFTKAKTA